MDAEKTLRVIGTYAIANTGSVLVHEIDPYGDWLIASINGENPEKYEIVTEETDDNPDGVEMGFYMGEWWIPLDQIMRT